MKYILAFYALQFVFCIIIYGFYNIKKAEEANIEKIDEVAKKINTEIDEVAKKLNSVSHNIILKNAKPVDYDKCIKALCQYSMGLAEIDEDDIIERIAEDSFLVKRRFK